MTASRLLKGLAQSDPIATLRVLPGPRPLAQIVDVNLRAPIVLTRLALPYLRSAGGGAVVNVASIAGQVPLPGETTYSSTKFGLRAFTFALERKEKRFEGIHYEVIRGRESKTGTIRLKSG